MSRIKPVPAIGLGLVSLAMACSPGPQDETLCMGMLGDDPAIEADLAEIGASVEAYCACFAKALQEEDEATRAAVRKVVGEVARRREVQNIGLEAAAEQLEEFAEGRATDPDLDISESEFRKGGEFVDGTRDTMRDNDGQCPRAES